MLAKKRTVWAKGAIVFREAHSEAPLRRWHLSQDQNERESKSIREKNNRASTLLINFKDKTYMSRCFDSGVALGPLVLLPNILGYMFTLPHCKMV